MPLQIFNIQRIEFGYQRKDPTRSVILDKEIASYCACRKTDFDIETRCGTPFNKGDFIVKVRVRVRTTTSENGEKNIWYVNNRWNFDCFIRWQQKHVREWQFENPYVPTLPRGRKPRKPYVPKPPQPKLQERLGLNTRQMLIRRGNQQALRSIERRIEEYTASPNPRRLKQLLYLEQRANEQREFLRFWNRKETSSDEG
jgi:hypothetical protein